MKKVTILCTLTLIASTLMGYAANKEIVAAADPWAPFADPADPREGISLAIIRAAYATQGYTVKMVYVPWARAVQGVTKGSFDILPTVWISDARLKVLEFSEPYAVNEIKFIKTIDDDFEYTDLSSLDGKRVGTVRGYGYGDEFLAAKNFKRDEVSTLLQNIAKLTHDNKRIDLTLDDEIVARVTIANEDPQLLEKVRFVETPYSSKKLYVAAGLANPRHEEIISAFNTGLKEIEANGKLEEIRKSYGLE